MLFWKLHSMCPQQWTYLDSKIILFVQKIKSLLFAMADILFQLEDGEVSKLN